MSVQADRRHVWDESYHRGKDIAKMIRKALAVIMSLVVAATLFGCSELINPDSGGTSSGEKKTETKVLVAYFSRAANIGDTSGITDADSSASINIVDGTVAGSTEILAKAAVEATGGEAYEIRTLNTYPSTYEDTAAQAMNEQEQNSRPALSGNVADFDSYDVVVLIYPIWWSELPQPVKTFLESYDWSGKTVIPVAVHGGSGLADSVDNIAELVHGISIDEGIAISGRDLAAGADQLKTALADRI